MTDGGPGGPEEAGDPAADRSRDASRDTSADAGDVEHPAAFVLPPPAPDRAPGRRARRPTWMLPAGISLVLLLILAAMLVTERDQLATGTGSDAASPDPTDAGTDSTGTTTAASSVTSLEPLGPHEGWVDPESVGRPYGDTVPGLLTFRGNPTRTYYGQGPVPSNRLRPGTARSDPAAPSPT